MRDEEEEKGEVFKVEAQRERQQLVMFSFHNNTYISRSAPKISAVGCIVFFS